MIAADCLDTDQVFSHVAGDGTVRHFNCGELMRGAIARTMKPECVVIDLDEGLIAMVRERHGIEPGRLECVDADGLTPLLIAQFDDGSHVIVDGNHRAVRAWDAGLRSHRAMIFSPADWQRCLVTDLPTDADELYAAGVFDTEPLPCRTA